jgi:hypothetical protein
MIILTRKTENSVKNPVLVAVLRDKIFQPSKVPTKIYILACAHVFFNINMSLIQTTRAHTPRGQTTLLTVWGSLLLPVNFINRTNAPLTTIYERRFLRTQARSLKSTSGNLYPGPDRDT